MEMFTPIGPKVAEMQKKKKYNFQKMGNIVLVGTTEKIILQKFDKFLVGLVEVVLLEKLRANDIEQYKGTSYTCIFHYTYVLSTSPNFIPFCSSHSFPRKLRPLVSP